MQTTVPVTTNRTTVLPEEVVLAPTQYQVIPVPTQCYVLLVPTQCYAGTALYLVVY